MRRIGTWIGLMIVTVAVAGGCKRGDPTPTVPKPAPEKKTPTGAGPKVEQGVRF